MPAPDAFVVGETVVLRVTISDPRTRAAIDPTSVTLVGLWLGSSPVSLPDARIFTREQAGSYALYLSTGALAAGAYTWRALASGASGVSVVEDTLVLRTGPPL